MNIRTETTKKEIMLYWGLFMGCVIGFFILGLCVTARKGDAAEAYLEYKDPMSGKVAGETAG